MVLPPCRYNRNRRITAPEAHRTLPLYEYRCTQCGHRFEKIQGFSSEPESVCPKCGGALTRPLTAPALQFKGAGWYVNDYAPKAASSASSESKPAESDTSKDSKPAASEPAAKASTSEPSSSPSSTDSGSKSSTTSSS